MKFDAPIEDMALQQVADQARQLEALGFDGVWSFETRRDPFLPLLPVALATERLQIGTNIAVAFARSPFSMAMLAWDLQRASHGRLLLGLGTQVRAHVERRFSMPFEHPAARITEYIHCLRAVWRTFQSGARPDFKGRFYRFELINDFFNPGPIEHPEIPVYLAGVNPRMARAAGEAADGFSVHPMHSPGYLRDVIRPALDEGARKRGLSATDLMLATSTFVVSGATQAERSRAEGALRRQVAFYASTPSYRTFLDYHGYADTGRQLSALMRSGDLRAMPGLVPDGLLAEVAVSEADGDLASAIGARYADTQVQRVSLYESAAPAVDEEHMKRLVQRVHALP